MRLERIPSHYRAEIDNLFNDRNRPVIEVNLGKATLASMFIMFFVGSASALGVRSVLNLIIDLMPYK
jgi:hypothetical protein